MSKVSDILELLERGSKFINSEDLPEDIYKWQLSLRHMKPEEIIETKDMYLLWYDITAFYRKDLVRLLSIKEFEGISKGTTGSKKSRVAVLFKK